MSEQTDWIHRILDGEGGHRPTAGSEEASLVARYEGVLDELPVCREPAPADLVARVLAELPPAPELTWGDRLRRLWHGGGRWVAPALAGALASLLVVLAVERLDTPQEGVAVTFELHAPDAGRVELVGTFNDWRPGEIVLQGPDASGHWTATVNLPSGRHEYLFLVDGGTLVTDPRATAHRPDGFGQTNALLEL